MGICVFNLGGSPSDCYRSGSEWGRQLVIQVTYEPRGQTGPFAPVPHLIEPHRCVNLLSYNPVEVMSSKELVIKSSRNIEMFSYLTSKCCPYLSSA